MRTIASETLERAREMRASGFTWGEIADATGMTKGEARYRLDETYAQKRRESLRGPASKVYVASSQRMSEAEILLRLDSVPRDTRSPFARMAGDPLPGRSALDQKRAAS